MELLAIQEKLKHIKKGSFQKVSWVSDVLPVGRHKDPETGKETILTVSVVTTAIVRIGINYSKIKAVIEKGELASRTKVIGGKEVVSRKREPWFEHVEEVPGLVQHKAHKEQYYLQMFRSNAKNIKTGEFRQPQLSYIFMMGTPDEEVLDEYSSAKGKALLEALAKKRPAHEKPEQVWVKPIKNIVSIGVKSK